MKPGHNNHSVARKSDLIALFGVRTAVFNFCSPLSFSRENQKYGLRNQNVCLVKPNICIHVNSDRKIIHAM